MFKDLLLHGIQREQAYPFIYIYKQVVRYEHAHIGFLILFKDLLFHGLQMEQAYHLQRLMWDLQNLAFLTGLVSQDGNEFCRVEVF